LLKPTAGRILIDDMDIDQIQLKSLRRQIGLVTQESVLIQGTIYENIRLGYRKATRADVEMAAKRAHAWEFICNIPGGLDGQVSEQGASLSGGQRQRLAIARAVYGAPKYIVMDEPNSNLDDPGEAALVQTISKLKEMGTTVVLTTHRPRLVGAVDLMLVLQAGKQVAFGPAKGILDAVRQQQAGTAAAGRNLVAVPTAAAYPTSPLEAAGGAA
jgi:ABC-type bacteriocin/lantibiotic exporter with double-glycine peptidase domain